MMNADISIADYLLSYIFINKNDPKNNTNYDDDYYRSQIEVDIEMDKTDSKTIKDLK